jgi:hypothetical protein
MGKLAAVVVCVVVLAGGAGGIVALHAWNGEQPFRFEQSRALLLQPAQVLVAASIQSVAVKAPEPVSAARRTRAIKARCSAGGPAPLRNPWSCVIRYRSGTQARYRIVVQPDGRYEGVGAGIISGCCIKTPMLY